MKKIVLSVAAVFAFGFAAQAQEVGEGFGYSKGDVFLSGSIGFGSNKFVGDNYKQNSFSFAPQAGYFVNDNIAVGLRLGVANSKVTANEGDKAFKVNELAIGAFGRYYFTPSSKFSLFGQLAADYASVDYKSNDYKVNAFSVELAPGVSYFLNSNFALEATWGLINYTNSKPDFDGAETASSFNAAVDLTNIKLGLVYKF
ncbi:outer membrane beta-barrel protein [Flavobacterium sp. HSC-61S13]|uniref:outer membrane beta-barrel protein n=1 Tax=Flavobacterium sp. HSC-61S13 TaxID=2910963 RepID=UPI0020A1FDAD|nr:outer membrane beta-barrel protein [Flavobacterium sp. HSC-61S13]MCP1995625.1 outer membrane protein W [Flavobacterium sp. HSC-61S13]